MIFNLNLSNELTYYPEECSFRTIYDKEKGSEVCFHYHYSFEDVLLNIKRVWSGAKLPFTSKEKEIIEAGLPLPPKDNETLYIPTGKYKLMQSVPIESEAELRRILLPFTVSEQEGDFYLRFIKESEIECVMQLFFPC